MNKRASKLENTITFKYKDSAFQFRLSSDSVECHADYDYQKVCGSEFPDCEHTYGRCMEIKDISFKGFNKYELAKNNISLVEGNDSLLPEVVELVCRALSGIDFSSYIDVEGVRDYYGESLVKKVDLKSIQERVITNLKIERFEDIELYA